MTMTLRSPKSSAAPKRIFAAAKKNDTLELLIYDSIGESWFGGGVTATSVKQKLDEAGEVSKIVVRINSPGGDVFDGSAIYSLLSQHKAEVECYVDGLAASAAFTVAMAADTIHISESAMMMCHNAWGMVMGYAADMTQMAALLNKISGTMRDIYSKRCGRSADEVQALMDEETWMTAKEAVENGFADDVVQREPEAEEDAKALAASWDLSKFKHAPRAEKKEATASAEYCACACAECKADNCAECSNEDCKDPNCDGHEHPDEDDKSHAAALAEVERMREEFAVLSI